MIWSIFGLLHAKSRENFSKGIYQISLSELTYEEIKHKFQSDLEEAE